MSTNSRGHGSEGFARTARVAGSLTHTSPSSATSNLRSECQGLGADAAEHDPELEDHRC